MMQMFRQTALFALLAILVSPAFATDAHDDHHGEEFKAGEMITHHIADAHVIHLFGNVHIPLPCFIWTEQGLDVFLSSEFHYHEGHPTTTYTSPKGYTYENHHETIYIVDGMDAGHSHEAEGHSEHTGSGDHGHDHHGVKPLDLSITKTVFGMLFIMIIMCFVFFRVAKRYKQREGQAPKGIQNFFEPLILFIRDEVAVPSIGKGKADRYMPFLLTVFFFIWMCNILGLIPFVGGFNVTGTMGVTIVLAAIVWLMTMFSGNKHYWGHIFWPPGVPMFVKVILVPIEIASIFIKPAVLMVRLTANITAGHIIILAFVSLIMIFGQGGEAAGLGVGVGVGATAFMIFMFFIELLVAFLQAYVFTLLAAIYFGEATHEEHH